MNNRVKRILDIAQQEGTDAVLITAIPTILYLTGFAGFSSEERDAYILLTKKNKYIFSNNLYKEACEKYLSEFTFIEIARYQPLKASLAEVLTKHNISVLGIESDHLTAREYLVIKKFAKLRHVKTWKSRVKKDAQEIAAIEQACAIGDAAFAHTLQYIKPGITEQELAFELELYIRKQAADVSFRTIVAFGPNASHPHHVTSNQKLTTNNWVLMDFGVKYQNYCSDMTRTIFFGKATSEQKKMYDTVLDAQQKAIDYIIGFYSSRERSDSRSNSSRLRSNNISASEPDRIAREHIISKGYPSIPHSLGHGIGVEVHEAPRLSPHSKDILEPGMVFSVEPGVYLPGIGGVRIEDLVTIHSKSVRVLTTAPRNFIEVN